MTVPDRADADPEYRFDPTRVFDSPDEWRAARSRLRADLDALEDLASEPIETTDDLRTLLRRVETCYRRKQRIDLYRDVANGEFETGGPNGDDDLGSAFEAGVASVRRRLRETDGATLDELVSGLDDYRRYAANVREQASRLRSPEVEAVVSAFGETGRAPTEVIRSVWRDYDPPTVRRPDGELVELNGGVKRRSELGNPDRDYRRRVHEAFWDELERFEETLATAYGAKLRAASAEAQVRGYDSIRDRDLHGPCHPDSGLRSALPERVHDVMLQTVRDTLGPYHDALRRRRERLGVDDLRLWDMDVPVVDGVAPDVDYESAKGHVLSALSPLGEDYVDRARRLFSERRIDVYPGDVKGDLAHCLYSATDGPFVHANFRGDVRSTFVLCHELGHALHADHFCEAPTRYATCPRPVGEVPAALHELLLAEHLVAEGGDLAEAARDRLLTSLRASFYRSTMVSAFVHDLARRVERGESPTPAEIRGIQRDTLTEFRAPVTLGDDAGRTWLGRGTRTFYDSYAYVLGATGALAVREQLRTGDLTPDAYRDVLRSTGREPSVALFERLGCDVTSPDPYRRAAAAFEDYVDGTGFDA